jgi:hypothetical protein
MLHAVTHSLFFMQIYKQFSPPIFGEGLPLPARNRSSPHEKKAAPGPAGSARTRRPRSCGRWCPFFVSFFSNEKTQNIFCEKKLKKNSEKNLLFIIYYYGGK